MDYNYYLVSHAKGTSKEVSTGVYEPDTETAATVGTYLLNQFYGTNLRVEEVDVELVEGLTSEDITTT